METAKQSALASSQDDLLLLPSGGTSRLRKRVLAAFAAVVVLAYLLFFVLDSLESQGSSALGLANEVGLITVAIGIVVAGVVMRRTWRP
jgi:hypothetical protein